MKQREAVMVTLTVMRLLLVWGLIASLSGPFWWVVVWLAVILVVDLFDGVIARRLEADGFWRRITDVVVDQITIYAALVAVFLTHPAYLTDGLMVMYWAWIAASRLLVAAIGWLALKRHNVFMRAKGYHKISGLTFAALGLFMAYGTGFPTIYQVASTAGLINFLLAWDFWSRYRRDIRTYHGGPINYETPGLPQFPAVIKPRNPVT